jgi:hypothetical protein
MTYVSGGSSRYRLATAELRADKELERLHLSTFMACAPSRPRRHLQDWWWRRSIRHTLEKLAARKTCSFGHGLSSETRATLVDRNERRHRAKLAIVDCMTTFSNLRIGPRKELNNAIPEFGDG